MSRGVDALLQPGAQRDAVHRRLGLLQPDAARRADARGARVEHRRTRRRRLPGRAGGSACPAAGLASSRRRCRRGGVPDRAQLRPHHAPQRRPMDGRARAPGLEVPELDRLRRESLYADAARPPAGTPEVSMPALITGRPVVAVSPVSPNDLELTFRDGERARWSAYPNVFARARTLGYDTAVIGWHLPYPRVLGRSLGGAGRRPADANAQA